VVDEIYFTYSYYDWDDGSYPMGRFADQKEARNKFRTPWYFPFFRGDHIKPERSFLDYCIRKLFAGALHPRGEILKYHYSRNA
jgi:hypothetical protein